MITLTDGTFTIYSLFSWKPHETVTRTSCPKATWRPLHPMVSVDPNREGGKELLNHLELLSGHWGVVGPFQVIAGRQSAQLPASSSVYKLEVTSHLGPRWSVRVLKGCADVPGAELSLSQTKRGSWLISHDLSVWWWYWRGLQVVRLFDCSAMWLIIPTQSNHENYSLKFLLSSTETDHTIQRQR